MSRSTAFTPLVLTAAVLPCGLLAWSLGGDAGRGVLLGYLLGAGVSGLSFAWQRHQWCYRPERALRAHLESFLAKLAALVLSLLALRALEPVAAQLDLRAYVLGYAGAIALALPLLALDANRLLGPARRNA